DIAALALGIDGVESERGFARAGQAGEHHQPVARDVEVDILEVMLACAADGDHAAVGAGFVEKFVHSWVRSSPRQPQERSENADVLPGQGPALAGESLPCFSGATPWGCAVERRSLRALRLGRFRLCGR